MANSLTEHSRKLRNKTSAQWSKKQLQTGAMRQMLLKMHTEIADDFDAIAKQMGLSRPQALKALCECWHEHHA